MDWRSLAACRGLPTEWWFPQAGDAKTVSRAAVEVCTGCPVKAECLQFSVQTEQMGIWGGLGTNARTRLVGKKFAHGVTERQLGMFKLRSKCPCGAEIVEGKGHMCQTYVEKGVCVECDKFSMGLDDDGLCPKCRAGLLRVVA